MKIRTDFVTNSSSSNFCVVRFITSDDREYDIELGEFSEFYKDDMPRITDGKLIYTVEGKPPAEIKSVIDLAAALYYSQCKTAISPEAFFALFAFAFGKISAEEASERIGDDKAVKDYLTSIIKTDQNDKTANIFKFLRYMPYVEFEDCRDQYKWFIEEVKSLSDIKQVIIINAEDGYGESLLWCYNEYEAAVNKYGFSAVSKDSPDYERVFKKWVDIMDKEVFINSMPLEITIEQLVETALESGDPMDLLPRYIGRAEIDFAQLTDE